MPEKATVKKDQQKNKKPKPIRKKKNQENGTKFLDEPVLHLQNIFKQKKKGKIEKNEENVKTVAKNLSKKRSGESNKQIKLKI